MSKYLYGALHQTNKFTVAYTDDKRLVLYDGEDMINSFEFDESDLRWLKEFINKAYEKQK